MSTASVIQHLMNRLEGSYRPSCAATTVLKPRSGWQPINLRDIWQYRDLLWFLSLRDIRIRYKQTALGAIWAVLQPFVTMIVFSVFFGNFLGVSDKTGDIPYPIFVYAGLLPWMCFAASVTASSNSLVGNAHMLSKIYLPRLIMPLASVGAPLLDFCVAFVILLGMMAWFSVGITVQILLLPLLMISMFIAALGVGILLSALTVSYRDFRYVVPFTIQIWFYLSPVIWPVTVVPQKFAWIMNLNPMGGTISAFRAAMLGTPVDYTAWAVSTSVAALILLVALAYFAKTERTFADVI